MTTKKPFSDQPIVELVGVHALTMLQAKALWMLAMSSLQANECRHKDDQTLTPKETRSAEQAVEKLERAIRFRE